MLLALLLVGVGYAAFVASNNNGQGTPAANTNNETPINTANNLNGNTPSDAPDLDTVDQELDKLDNELQNIENDLNADNLSDQNLGI